MLEMKNRLENLALDVANRRSKGFIKKWSEEIKNEAIYLSKELGINEVCHQTGLNWPSIRNWIKADKEKMPDKNLSDKEEQIFVTRIIANKADQASNKKIVLASILKNKIELQIYNKEMLENLVEKFFT